MDELTLKGILNDTTKSAWYKEVLIATELEKEKIRAEEIPGEIPLNQITEITVEDSDTVKCPYCDEWHVVYDAHDDEYSEHTQYIVHESMIIQVGIDDCLLKGFVSNRMDMLSKIMGITEPHSRHVEGLNLFSWSIKMYGYNDYINGHHDNHENDHKFDGAWVEYLEGDGKYLYELIRENWWRYAESIDGVGANGIVQIGCTGRSGGYLIVEGLYGHGLTNLDAKDILESWTATDLEEALKVMEDINAHVKGRRDFAQQEYAFYREQWETEMKENESKGDTQ
ncbi:MAG: hypothetical protein DRI46_08020 [Chloroflexi bacterium]|nr:MAG: hypothetical protein DRI46_08020 [Chloroflexota bacterium]